MNTSLRAAGGWVKGKLRGKVERKLRGRIELGGGVGGGGGGVWVCWRGWGLNM